MSEADHKLRENQAEAWCVLDTYAEMARREFKSLDEATQKRLDRIRELLEFVEGRNESM